eukprot:m.147110 g.147110  ORF g.147110 m.147110 type:complete len:719 (+) comp14160_c0_seq8:274-2430(+)
MYTEKQVKAMKVTELKDALRSMNLPLAGKKADLCERLLQAIAKAEEAAAVHSAEADAASEAVAEAEEAAAAAATAIAAAGTPPPKEPLPKPVQEPEPVQESVEEPVSKAMDTEVDSMPQPQPEAQPQPTQNGSGGAAEPKLKPNAGEADKKVGRRANGKKKKAKKKKKRQQLTSTSSSTESDTKDQPATNGSVDDAKANAEEPLYEIQYADEEFQADPSMSHFAGIFDKFKFEDKPPKEEAESTTTSAQAQLLSQVPELHFEEDEVDALEKATLKRLKKQSRLTIAQLKQLVERPDVVEVHDVNAADPRLLIHLKGTRNTVPVPRHWCHKRKYLQGKRGIEKAPFELPEYIRRTGITEMREALAEKEDAQGLKAKMREKTRPKMGKIDIDYQKLHDAFFRWQTKPKMTIHGDIYYEGKEFETKMPDRKPGELSTELRQALGMPTATDAPPVPPPWLMHMQRVGPPPSYPNLKIPGLNAPIPPGASFGFHAGGWGKAPVDEQGVPIYGDVFGASTTNQDVDEFDTAVPRDLWGQLESEESGESSSEDESDEEDSDASDEDVKDTGFETPSGIASTTPSGTSSVGHDTPQSLDLRKRKIVETMETRGDQPSLYKIIPQVDTSVGKAMMGSQHQYDLQAAVAGTAPSASGASKSKDGVEVSLVNPDAVGEDLLAAHYQQAQPKHEDHSDMVAEHTARAKAKERAKRKKNDTKTDKTKKFKF